MPTALESQGQQSEMQATLDQGIEVVSTQQRVQFRRYAKVVLAQDGFVFWVATDEEMTANGSLHYVTDRLQDLDQTIGANQVLLSSEEEITVFNQVGPDSMWIGTWPISEGLSLQIAFSQRGSYFEESKVWHYSGFAVYPALRSQLVASAADLPAGPIVSNSLPIWLLQNAMAPAYPSFLVPDNVSPPYIVVDIPPESTEALAAAPLVSWPGTVVPDSGASPLHQLSISQLSRDTVVLTLYGFDNQRAWQYLASLYEASIDGTAPFGFANSPVPVDQKRVQVEITALAQKKTIVIVANYDQAAADAVARRLILQAAVSSVTVIGGPFVSGTAETTQDEQTVTAVGSVFE